MSEKLIQVKNLKTYFHTEAGTAKAVFGQEQLPNVIAIDKNKNKS